MNYKSLLIPALDYIQESFEKRYHLEISREFLAAIDTCLTTQLQKEVGIPLGPNFCISMANEGNFFYESAPTSRLLSRLFVNHNWNDFVIYWKSKSGHVYLISDTNIPEGDIVAWAEGWDPRLYHAQMYPKTKIPFKLKDLGYELIVERLNIDAEIELKLKESSPPGEELAQQLHDWIQSFNRKSEKTERKDGVVHSWKTEVNGRTLQINADLGSAGVKFLKTFLKELSRMKEFELVTIK